jgi:hypothetical protein
MFKQFLIKWTRLGRIGVVKIMSITAFFPARSGSKRLKNKNIRMLGGKPLVVWTLEACIGSKHMDKVIFSTDSKQYWEQVSSFIPSDKLLLSLHTPQEAGDKVKFLIICSKILTVFLTKTPIACYLLYPLCHCGLVNISTMPSSMKIIKSVECFLPLSMTHR